MKVRCWKSGALGFAAGVLALAAPVEAAQVEVSSTTLISGRPEVRYGEIHSAVPMVEWLGLTASQFEVPAVEALQLRVAGWARLNAVEARDLAGDLDLAYLRGRLFEQRLSLSVGRHLVTGGAARFTHLDGASADLSIAGGLALAAFGGVPVVPRFAVARGDALYGGRLYWRRSLETEVGVSFMEVRDHGSTARLEAGLDLHHQATSTLSLAGTGLWSLAESRLAEVDVGPSWMATPELQLTASYRRTAPDLFLPRNSLFSVFAETERDQVGAGVTWQLHRQLGLYADYASLWTEDGRGDDATARLSFRSDPSSLLVLGAQARLLQVPVSGYSSGRLFGAYRPTPELTFSLEVDGYRFQRPINGVQTSITSAASGAYRFAHGWLGLLSVSGGRTVLLERRYEVLAKLVYSSP